MEQNVYNFHYRLQENTINDINILMDNLKEIDKAEKLHIDWKFIKDIADYCRRAIEFYNKDSKYSWKDAFSVLDTAQKESDQLQAKIVGLLTGVVKSQAQGCFWVVKKQFGRIHNIRINMDHDQPTVWCTSGKMNKGYPEEKVCGEMVFGFKIAFAKNVFVRFVAIDNDLSIYQKA